MKKFFLSLVVTISFAFAAKAQVTIIPKVGVTFAKSTYPTLSGYSQSATAGFLFGAGFNFATDADGFFSIQPELLYIQKGNKEKYNNEEFTTTLNYLELPILAKISFGSEKVKAYVNAGPSIGYALSQKLAFEGVSSERDFDDSQNRTEFGLQFGGGVGFKAGPGSLLLDFRYGYGLTSVNKTPSSANSSNNTGQNRVVAVSLGYAIPLGGK